MPHNLVPADEFMIAERRHALHLLWRSGAPGPDGISNQALKALGADVLPVLRNKFNHLEVQ